MWLFAATFGWLCVETYIMTSSSLQKAATFGWLCVETAYQVINDICSMQPPSGGCVLKQLDGDKTQYDAMQPPSGGCVLKLAIFQEFCKI